MIENIREKYYIKEAPIKTKEGFWDYTLIEIYKFENGKEVEVLQFMDTLSWYQQLGITPPTG